MSMTRPVFADKEPFETGYRLPHEYEIDMRLLETDTSTARG